MAPAVAATSFPPEAVPQAPEDPLFGLMKAYKADQSEDKVDLVGQTPSPFLVTAKTDYVRRHPIQDCANFSTVKMS